MPIACHQTDERRVEKMLAAQSQAGSFLERPAAEFPAAAAGEGAAAQGGRTVDEPVQLMPGAVIGPYKLLQQIGEGGMGVVWMAEQTQPVQRKVALKVIKPGMDSKQVVARFEAERQALAVMDHVNIARVFDGGETPPLTQGARLDRISSWSWFTASRSPSIATKTI